jgi:1-acyl-sn-glycerol-3-phosphate acyltransferase
LIAAVTTLVYGAIVVPHPLLRFRPRERLRWRDRMFRLWASSLARILRIRMEVEGERPAAPFLLVANHLSYIDVFVLASQGGVVFVAKDDVRSWPVVGRLCRSVDTIFVDRQSRRDAVRVKGEIMRARAAGSSVVLFPEGTSSDGSSVGPFKASLLEAAIAGSVAVHYAVLGYSTPAGHPPASLSVCWWGEMTFARHFLDLLALPGFCATLRYGATPLRGEDRKQLAADLHRAVISHLASRSAVESVAVGLEG